MNHDITAQRHWTVVTNAYSVFNEREIKLPYNLPLRRRMEIYDNLYRKMEKLLEKYNPCERRVEKGVMRCKVLKDISLCCNDRKCKYLTKKGCAVENLMCKLHICNDVQPSFEKKYPVLWKRWMLWHMMVYRLDLNRGWASKEEVKRAVKRFMK